jgi:hypothetical protein
MRTEARDARQANVPGSAGVGDAELAGLRSPASSSEVVPLRGCGSIIGQVSAAFASSVFYSDGLRTW